MESTRALGDECGPHCGLKDRVVGHCPCSATCHGRFVDETDLLARIEAELARNRATLQRSTPGPGPASVPSRA